MDGKLSAWFSNSKIADSNGNPLTVYHGTESTFDEFSKSSIGSSSGNSGFLGKGFYFTEDKNKATAYGKVSAYFLCLQSPLVIDGPLDEHTCDALNVCVDNEVFHEGENPADVYAGLSYAISVDDFLAEQITDKLEELGYDGVWDKVRGEIVAFSPKQIKSIHNNGTWSKETAKLVEENFRLGDNAFERASERLYEEIYKKGIE
jgi:hypothetical protein